MKKYLLGLVLIASSCAFGQNTNQFGAPSGACTLGPQTVTDISVTPAQMYVCAGTDGHTWVQVGSGTASIVPSTLKSRLVAEYHFQDGSGTVARDSSGNGNDISLTTSMNTPLWQNGGLNFPAPSSTTTQYAALIPPAVQAAGTTYLEVACFSPFFNGASPGLSGNYTAMMSDSTSGIAFDLGDIWGGATGVYGLGIEQGNSAGKTNSANYISSAGCHALTWQVPVSTGSGSDQLFYDGNEVSYNAQTNSHALLNVGSFYMGGCNSCGGGSRRNAAMTVYGLYVFNAPLTSNEVASFSGQALAAAQAQGAPVVPTPVNATGNIIVCGVDSLSYGTPGTPATGYCNATNLTPTETISHYYDIGVIGRYLTGANSAAPYELRLYNSPMAGHKTLQLWGCTNDAQSYTGGVAARDAAMQACVTTFASMAQTAHSLGYKVIAIPMISRNALDTIKNTYDGQFRATWQQYADGFADVANDPALGADGANTNTTYFAVDKTHLTATGYALVGTYVTNAYNKLYGSTATSYNTTSAAAYTIKAADSFLIADNTANAVVLTLPNCLGYAGSWKIKVLGGANAVTLKTATSAQTIDGTDYSSSGKTLAASTSSLLTVVPGAAATGGCTWMLN